jgi:hypothetical protein
VRNLFTFKRKENVMTITKLLTIFLVFAVATIIPTSQTLLADEVSRISKEEAKEMVDNPDVVFLDLRAGSDWRASDIKIKGAVREEPGNVQEWISKYDVERTYILYCA